MPDIACEFSQLAVAAGKPAGVLEVAAPYDGAVIGKVDMPEGSTIDKALDTAYSLFRDRSCWLPAMAAYGDTGTYREHDGAECRRTGTRCRP